MPNTEDPNDQAIRLAAVEAVSRRLGADPNPLPDGHSAAVRAATDVIQAAQYVADYIATGATSW